MIYDIPNQDEPIRQGDIFFGIPKVDIEFAAGLPTIGPSPDNDLTKTPWDTIAKRDEPTPAVLPVIAVPAIVASQDCDARWGVSITLCEIKEFPQVEADAATAKLSGMVKIITRHARSKLKWFYLPPDKRIGFNNRMAVDFFSTIRVLREDLEKLIDMRKGCLKQVARDHFRERIAHFYQRYAYNEWYPLSKEEMEIYSKDNQVQPSERYDWQK